MATHPAFQGQGAGAALLRHVTALADAEGMLGYVDSSPASGKVYGRFGWVAVGKGRLPEPEPEPATGEGEPVYATMMLREPVGDASTEAA
jgi:GNAT superfamily N-acetyltransferase